MAVYSTGQMPSYVEQMFPTKGMDLRYEHDVQPDGTTRLGVNVMAYEQSTGRSRGGSRPGNGKYIAGQVPNGSQLIQHLNIIVDPSADALLVNEDIPAGVDTIVDPSTNPPGSNPADPDDHTVRNRGGLVPVGGTGIQVNRNKKRKQESSNNKTYVFSAGPSGAPVGVNTTPPSLGFSLSALSPSFNGTVVQADLFGDSVTYSFSFSASLFTTGIAVTCTCSAVAAGSFAVVSGSPANNLLTFDDPIPPSVSFAAWGSMMIDFTFGFGGIKTINLSLTCTSGT